jgi:transposase InsO family protein
VENLSRYIVEAVILEGRHYREVATSLGVSKSLVYKLVKRYREQGEEGLAPKSKAPRSTPHKVCDALEREIILLRKQLVEDGYDGGAATIHAYLSRRRSDTPSPSAIYRVLKRNGFIVPQPHKRPKSSWIRFEASLPNECWQTDVTYWTLSDGRRVEILNFFDDHSRFLIASRVFGTVNVKSVIAVFSEAVETYGAPAAVLSDNGAVYTAWHLGGTNLFELELMAQGIQSKHSRPSHPQTCGKIERWHQSLKRFLSKKPRARTIKELQAQIDEFCRTYNDQRPNQGIGRRIPREVYNAREKARPGLKPLGADSLKRVRRDRLDSEGKVSLRFKGQMHHIRAGYEHRRKTVVLLINGLHLRIVERSTGELLRELILDPQKRYHGTGRPPGPLRPTRSKKR